MPYQVFTAGQEALAADVNNYLMEQTVARFTSSAQRASQLAAPELNQLSMTDDRPGALQRWTGSAWADVGNEGWAEAQVAVVGNPNTTVFYEFPLVMPRAGTLVVDGVVNANVGTGFNQFLLSFSGSAPAATNHTGTNSLLNSSYIGQGHAPIMGRWASVTAGQTVTVRVSLQVFGGSATISMAYIYLSWRVV